MMGYREDVPQILKSLDLFVLSSYSNEGVPQVLLQAMALEVPIVSTFAGGIEEMVKNGQTGTIVPSRNVPALSKAIYWAYQNKGESLKMARRAREVVLNKYAITGVIKNTEKIYRELIERDRYI